MQTLSDTSHRFKVRKNAEQNNLTGVCIFHPSFSMVYVEGAVKHMRFYRRLMLHRIKWTEQSRSRGEEEVELQEDEDGNPVGTSATAGAAAAGSGGAAEGENEYGSGSLENNRCDLIWEGELRERAFKTFKPRTCPTDAAAKEALSTLR